jgi:hypothetical protein
VCPLGDEPREPLIRRDAQQRTGVAAERPEAYEAVRAGPRDAQERLATCLDRSGEQ